MSGAKEVEALLKSRLHTRAAQQWLHKQTVLFSRHVLSGFCLILCRGLKAVSHATACHYTAEYTAEWDYINHSNNYKK